MAKIALITDLHIGARNDNEAIARVQNHFYSDFLVPFLTENSIHTVICGGDFFDKRQHVTLRSMQLARSIERSFDAAGIDFHCIVGNHDTLFRNTNDINSLSSFYENSKRFHIYSEPTELEEYNLLLVPWINSENSDSVLSTLSSSKSRFCLGHFSIQGFEFHKGTVCDHGLDESLFNHFELVMSGHFHTQSKRGNIVYLGCPYEMSWSDWNDPRGLHIFDTETGHLEFIQYTNYLFYTMTYRAGLESVTPVIQGDLEGRFVKVIVKDKGDAYEYDKFLHSVRAQNPADLQIIEVKQEAQSVLELTEEEIKERISGNLSVIKSFIDGSDIKESIRDSVMEEITMLYNEVER